jgi:hypothetical protein
MIKKIIIVNSIIILLAAPAFAQVPGDLNCNRFIDVNDLVHALNLVRNCEISHSECSRRNGDIDGDGRSMTIGDLLFVPFLIIPDSLPPDYSRHPDLDTIMVESAIASPGETLALPLWVKTVDTLVSLQLLLELDTDYLEFDTVIVYNNFPLVQKNCDGNIYCYAMGDFPISTILLLPGNHHIADIMVTVKLENDTPVTTSISFAADPPRALYTGFANSSFFEPIMVDAEIEILPLTAIEAPDETVPTDFSITAYPNPFNDALNISVYSDRATAITVYDIMGRPVRTFDISSGSNLVNWNATDNNDKSISAGIFFIGEKESGSFKKVLYLK